MAIFITVQYGTQLAPRFVSLPMPHDSGAWLSASSEERLWVTFLRPKPDESMMSQLERRLEAYSKLALSLDVCNGVLSGHGIFGLGRRAYRIKTGCTTFEFLRQKNAKPPSLAKFDMAVFSTGLKVFDGKTLSNQEVGGPTLPAKMVDRAVPGVPIYILSQEAVLGLDRGGEVLKLVSPAASVNLFEAGDWDSLVTHTSPEPKWEKPLEQVSLAPATR